MLVLITLLFPTGRIVQFIDGALSRYLLGGQSGICPKKMDMPIPMALPFLLGKIQWQVNYNLQEEFTRESKIQQQIQRWIGNQAPGALPICLRSRIHLHVLALCRGISSKRVLSGQVGSRYFPTLLQPARRSNFQKASTLLPRPKMGFCAWCILLHCTLLFQCFQDVPAPFWWRNSFFDYITVFNQASARSWGSRYCSNACISPLEFITIRVISEKAYLILSLWGNIIVALENISSNYQDTYLQIIIQGSMYEA